MCTPDVFTHWVDLAQLSFSSQTSILLEVEHGGATWWWQDITLKLCQTSKRAAGMDYAAVLTDILTPNYRGILKQSLKHSAVGLGQMLSFHLTT